MTGSSIPTLEKGSIFHEVNSIFENTTPKIINLSDYNLTSNEISLLKKGLNFCPIVMKLGQNNQLRDR